MLLKGALCQPGMFYVRIGRGRHRTVWKSLWIYLSVKGVRSVHFPFRSRGALRLFYLLFDCFIWLFQYLPSILTLFFCFLFYLSFYFYPKNLSIFYLSLAYEQEQGNLLRLARSLRFRDLEICSDVDKNAKPFPGDDLWDCVLCSHIQRVSGSWDQSFEISFYILYEKNPSSNGCVKQTFFFLLIVMLTHENSFENSFVKHNFWLSNKINFGSYQCQLLRETHH